jgi:hypothetical protein
VPRRVTPHREHGYYFSRFSRFAGYETYPVEPKLEQEI